MSVQMSQPDVPFIDFRGQRWYAPFKCLHCGHDVSARQFAFARLCGSCDVGEGPRMVHRVTRLCANGHITDLNGVPIAPLSPDGEQEWQRRMFGTFGGGHHQCRCLKVEPPK